MSKVTKAQRNACDKLLARVRYETAALRLPRHPSDEPGANDTALIREATRIYTETWIVPLINAIQSGNTDDMNFWSK
jgi:hypothetical protein